MNWAEIVKSCNAERFIECLKLENPIDDDWAPDGQDRELAWDLFVELRTRISSERLHFLSGDEGGALNSLYQMFQLTRDVVKRAGHQRHQVSGLTMAVLNQVIRDFTAEWHPRLLSNELELEDARREFRRKLDQVQNELFIFRNLLFVIVHDRQPDHVEHSKQRYEERIRKYHEPDAPTGKIAFDQLLGLEMKIDNASSPSDIVAAEQVEIHDRRRVTKTKRDADVEGGAPADLVGLAVSGGGIRSATFALGVTQGLAAKGVFQQIDIVSTVSGGGYLGSFFSSMMNTDSDKCGPRSDQIPFKPDVAGDSAAIRYLRNHSCYILPSNFLIWLRTLGLVAYGIFNTLMIFSTIVLCCVLLTKWRWGADIAALPDIITKCAAIPSYFWSISLPTTCLWIGSALALLILPCLQRLGRLNATSTKLSNYWEWATVGLFSLSILSTAFDYLPIAHYGYLSIIHALGAPLASESDEWTFASSLLAIGNGLALLASRSSWLQRLVESMPKLKGLFFLLIFLPGPLLVACLYFELSHQFVAADNTLFGLSSYCVLFCGVALCAAYSFFTNVNFTSLHRYYRNRLSETYLIQSEDDGTVKQKDIQLLSEMRDSPNSAAPYHILNAAVNLPTSNVAELRGRDSDFFFFSKHYCGSPIVGYHKTEDWQQADPHLDLGTAMAISGAAASPQMGTVSIKGASFLMTLLNVRLGYWLHRPVGKVMSSNLIRAFSGPGPRSLIREAMNRGEETHTYVNLSDGGHIENLGVYELLRRRCRFIVAIDGECDPELDCPSLMQLERFASIDLDIHIEIDLSRLQWVDIPSQSTSKEEQPAAATTRFTRGHFALGRIDYPDGLTGWLVYVKLSVTGNEPDYVLDYRRRFPDFPHQSTADQVFEEDQFEAYRRLGEHVTEDLFSEELLRDEEKRAAAENGELAVDAWYQELVNGFVRRSD